MPTIPGYEVATWWFPNEAVGGDYCDVVALASGEVAICVADVSGHGLGPSLLMASVRASLRTLLAEHRSPQVLLERLAVALAPDFEYGSFITMFLTLLHPQQNKLEFSNAGHGPALVYRAASGEFTELESTGVPLGVLIPTEYPPGPAVAMKPGDLLILTTDGIVEAMDQGGQLFGVERLKSIIRQTHTAPLREFVRNIGRQVELYYIGDSPPDDLTVVALRKT